MVLSISFAMLDPANGEYPPGSHDPSVGINPSIDRDTAGIPQGLLGRASRIGREVSGAPHPLALLGCTMCEGLLGRAHDEMNRAP